MEVLEEDYLNYRIVSTQYLGQALERAGIPIMRPTGGHAVDGTDLAACLKTMQTAVLAARSGQGPQLVVAELLRLCGHGEHDDASYITTEMKNSPVGKDCIKVAEELLLREGPLTPDALSTLRHECVTAVDQAVATAQRELTPDPYTETWQALSAGHLIETRQEAQPPGRSNS